MSVNDDICIMSASGDIYSVSVYDYTMDFEISEPRRLGRVVRELRRGKNMTQADLADQAGVSRGYLVRLEQGHPRAELSTVVTVLRALGARLMVAPGDEVDEALVALQAEFDRIIDG